MATFNPWVTEKIVEWAADNDLVEVILALEDKQGPLEFENETVNRRMRLALLLHRVERRDNLMLAVEDFEAVVPQDWDRSDGSRFGNLLHELKIHAVVSDAEELVDADDGTPLSKALVRTMKQSLTEDEDADAREELTAYAKAVKTLEKKPKAKKATKFCNAFHETHEYEAFKQDLTTYAEPIKRLFDPSYLDQVSKAMASGRLSPGDVFHIPDGPTAAAAAAAAAGGDDDDSDGGGLEFDMDTLAAAFVGNEEQWEEVIRESPLKDDEVRRSRRKPSGSKKKGGKKGAKKGGKKGSKKVSKRKRTPSLSSEDEAMVDAKEEAVAQSMRDGSRRLLTQGEDPLEAMNAVADGVMRKRRGGRASKRQKVDKQGQTVEWVSGDEDSGAGGAGAGGESSSGGVGGIQRLTSVRTKTFASLSPASARKKQKKGGKKKDKGKAKGSKKAGAKAKAKKGKQRRRQWTDEEVQNLIEGVRKFGVGRWAEIVDNFEFEDRTSVNLKDKWRNLKKSNTPV